MALNNFSWVIPGKLAGSAIPGGRLSSVRPFLESDIRELKREGVDCLVSLLKVHPVLGEVCEETGVEWIQYPIEDFGLPTDPDAFEKLVSGLVARIESGKRVCVHCRMGIGRTGVVLACVVGRLFGIPGAQAIRTVRKIRDAIETDGQAAFVEDFCASTPTKGS
jgi:protein-tyrosine phosphatase